MLHLLHGLYSLKQAGLAWWETLDESMNELRFECLKSNAGIFLYWKKGMNIVVTVVYIDDILFYGPTKAIVDEIKGLFIMKWEYRDLGPATSFLNMWIKCKGHKILIDQCSYLKKVLEHFGMQNARTAPTPLPQGYYLLQFSSLTVLFSLYLLFMPHLPSWGPSLTSIITIFLSWDLSCSMYVPSNSYTVHCITTGQGISFLSLLLVMDTYSSSRFSHINYVFLLLIFPSLMFHDLLPLLSRTFYLVPYCFFTYSAYLFQSI